MRVSADPARSRAQPDPRGCAPCAALGSESFIFLKDFLPPTFFFFFFC